MIDTYVIIHAIDTLRSHAINVSDLGMLRISVAHPRPPLNIAQGTTVRILVRMAFGRPIALTVLGTMLLHLGTVQYTSSNLKLWGIVFGIIVVTERLSPVWRSVASLGRGRLRVLDLETHTRRLLRSMSVPSANLSHLDSLGSTVSGVPSIVTAAKSLLSFSRFYDSQLDRIINNSVLQDFEPPALPCYPPHAPDTGGTMNWYRRAP